MDVAPGVSFNATAEGFLTGLVGTITVSVIDWTGATVVASRTAGITEHSTIAGKYLATDVPAPITPGNYQIDWYDGVDHAYEDLNVGVGLYRSLAALGLDANLRGYS